MRGAPDTEPWSDCSALLDDPERLRSTAAERGYLFVARTAAGGSTRWRCGRTCCAYCATMARSPTASEVDAGIARPGLVLEGSNPTEQYRAYYNKVLSVHSFNALPHHPRIMAVVEQLVGEPRCWSTRGTSATPSSRALETFKTPPHQDHFSVGGTPATWTVWLPLGDCDSALGGVMLAEGSHADGLLPAVEGSIWVDPGTDHGAGPGARWPPATWSCFTAWPCNAGPRQH